MTDIASISLRVNTSELERGSKALDDFREAASGAAHGADSFGTSNKNAAKQTAENARELEAVHQRVRAYVDAQRQGQNSTQTATQATARQREELQGLLDRINPTNKAFAELDEITRKLAQANKNGLLPTDQFRYYNAILDDTRNKLQRTADALTAEGRALSGQTRATQRAADARVAFIQKLKDQVATQSVSRTELLRFQAAQLGVGSSAEVYIRHLRETSRATHELSLNSAGARRELGVLIGELARGNFGALRGSGITLANRAGWIDKLFTLRGMGIAGMVGGIAAAVYGLGKAWYEGSHESVEFNKQLILTGNYAGKTTAQLQDMAKAISGNGITQHTASGALAQVVGSGSFKPWQLESVAKAAAAMQEATGQSVDATIKNFQKLYDSPTSATEALNKQLHYLTASQYEYIASLERRGFKEAAGEAAAKAYADAMQERARKVIENLGFIESAIRSATNRWKAFWDAAMNAGRPMTEAYQLDQVNKAIHQIYADRAKSGNTGLFSDGLDSLVSQKSQIEFVMKSQQGYVEATNKIRLADDARTKSLEYQNEILSRNHSWREKRTASLNTLWLMVSRAPKDWTQSQRKTAVAQINWNNRPPRIRKGPQYHTPMGDRASDVAQTELLSLQAQLRTLQEHRSINDVTSQQRLELQRTESKFSVLEEAARTRTLTVQEKSLLASKDQVLALARQKALLGDQITAQERLNKRMDTAQKYVNQMAEKSGALEIGAGMSDRLAQRELAKSQLASGWKNAGGDLSESGYREELSAAQKYYAAEDALRSNWQKGVQKGWSEFADEATDTYSQVEGVTRNAFTGMASTLTDFFTTGKASFKDFLTTFLKGTVQMITQLALLNSMKMVADGTRFGAFLGFAGGGYTGDGDKHQPKGVVHGGEFVFTREATQRIGVPNLYSMMRGYAEGGFVSDRPPAPIMQPVGKGSAGFVMNNVFNINGQQMQSTLTGPAAGSGKAAKELIINLISQQLDKALGQSGRISTFVNNRIGR